MREVVGGFKVGVILEFRFEYANLGKLNGLLLVHLRIPSEYAH